MCALEKPVWREEIRGTFHSTKTFENSETAANGTEISHESFQKLPCKFFSKIWVYLTRLASLLEILENAVSFASGSCHKFKPDVLVELEAAKIDWSRRLTCGDFKVLTQLKQSLLCSSSLNKPVWRVQTIGLRRRLRLDAIKAEPSFLLLSQEEDMRRHSWKGVLL